jgi:membrane fusion protein (multidrug efflux system)
MTAGRRSVAGACGLALLLAGLAVVTGCDRGSHAEGPPAGTRPEAVPVTVANVAIRRVERTVSVVGTLAANAQAELASEVEGQVVAIVADLGDRVTAGQVLARVRQDVTEAKLREAEATVEKSIADEARARPLQSSGVISTQEYDQVRWSLETARARRDQLRIELERLAIKAPFDGSVAARLIDSGSYVRPGTVVFRLVQDDPLRFRGEIPERDVPAVQAGQGVRVNVDAFPGETFEGRVARVGSASDPTARALSFEAELPNPEHRIRPGFFGHGEIVVSKDDRALAVPRSALSTFAGVTKLFVVEEGVAHERAVQLGVDLGDGWVEIAHGVAQGKVVATSGLSKLADGTPVVVREDQPPGA